MDHWSNNVEMEGFKPLERYARRFYWLG